MLRGVGGAACEGRSYPDRGRPCKNASFEFDFCPLFGPDNIDYNVYYDWF